MDKNFDREIEKMQRLKALMDEYQSDGITADEVREIMEAMVGVVADLKDSLTEQMGFGMREANTKHSGLLSQVQGLQSALQNLSQTMEQIRKEMMTAHEQGIEEVRGEIPEMPDLKPIEKKMADMKKMCEEMDNGDHMVEKINTGEKKIKRERVEGLDAELKRIEGRAISNQGSPRRIYQPYRSDLSSQCDGNNKSFYLDRSPLDEGTIMVFGTDFPVILRPTIDFTVSGKTITLTSAVPAPNSGSTLLATYFA